MRAARVDGRIEAGGISGSAEPVGRCPTRPRGLTLLPRIRDDASMAVDDAQARAWLERICAADQGAMAQFYRAFAPQVHAFAMRQLNNAAEAEDVVVDSMTEVWTTAGRFAGQSLVRTWLFSIARHRLLDRLRKRRPHESADIDELAEVLASDDESAFERLARQQRAEHVAHCLEKLSDEHRECMHLVFFEELPLAEIAQIQACPENTVKTRLFHARQKMKRCLERWLQVERDDGD
jgi:RNA polymerase sigma-70 factor (ECF subfamily)